MTAVVYHGMIFEERNGDGDTKTVDSLDEHEDDAMPSSALLNMGQSFSMGPPGMDRGRNENGDDIADVIAPDDDDIDDKDGDGIDEQMPLEAASHIQPPLFDAAHPTP